jgi:hypothetical protein
MQSDAISLTLTLEQVTPDRACDTFPPPPPPNPETVACDTISNTTTTYQTRWAQAFQVQVR